MDLSAFLYKLISKEHALIIKDFPDWVELYFSDGMIQRCLLCVNKPKIVGTFVLTLPGPAFSVARQGEILISGLP